MSPRRRYTLVLDEAQRDRLRFVKRETGIPESEQIRRALDDWHAKRRIPKSATRGGRTPRKA